MKDVVSALDLISWKKILLKKGGAKNELDWLLKVGAGLTAQDIHNCFVSPESNLNINFSLVELEKIWEEFINTHKPLQYILGKTPWRDFTLFIDENVLIPRPETELIIDYALEKKNINKWVDLGTGSGAIAIALARELKDTEGHAVDCSKKALKIAKKNMQILCNNSNVEFHYGDWWEPLSSHFEYFDLAVANPPYIPEKLFNQLEPNVKNFEPSIALNGGKDGLDSILEIINSGIKAIKSSGWLIIENHFDQSDKVLKIMNEKGFTNLDFKKDLRGVRRFAIGQKP
tara:strand:+ start:78 stop:938 length:861 start_codon:yes stop_codon:yes gene_type:complete